MTVEQPKQPVDEWEFLPSDDELEEQVGLSPEASALHLERDVHDVLPAEDPGRAEVALGADDDGRVPATYFGDEQPEDAPRWAESATRPSPTSSRSSRASTTPSSPTRTDANDHDGTSATPAATAGSRPRAGPVRTVVHPTTGR
ncbi:MAG: hypothetical protein R2726_08830 [Acidimicrobiales bacterium]